MQTLCCHVAALAVASIFYTWRAYAADVLARHRTLRDRVAYMLWVAADVRGSRTLLRLGPGKTAAGV
jgi:hypothetical protein